MAAYTGAIYQSCSGGMVAHPFNPFRFLSTWPSISADGIYSTWRYLSETKNNLKNVIYQVWSINNWFLNVFLFLSDTYLLSSHLITSSADVLPLELLFWFPFLFQYNNQIHFEKSPLDDSLCFAGWQCSTQLQKMLKHLKKSWGQ